MSTYARRERHTRPRYRIVPDYEHLTERELDVLMCICEGQDSTEIAKDLHITKWTAKTHMKHIREKLGARTMAQAVANAYHAGIIIPRCDSG